MSDRIGGNCQTIIDGKFRYDSGAHRFHDKIPEVTSLVKKLLGDNLIEVDSPSQIFKNNVFINFPLELKNILTTLPFHRISKIVLEVIFIFSSFKSEFRNFKELSIGSYGKTLSNLFLLNYTRKLWGLDPEKLSIKISGNRLKNLGFRSFISSFFSKNYTKHLDGKFYYPKYGYGMIFDKIAEVIGQEKINCNSQIIKIKHFNNKIISIVKNKGKEIAVDRLICTIPINIIINLLSPNCPDEIVKISRSFKFRHVRLAIIYLNQPQFSNNASIYFPEQKFSFTRLYEPKNRSSIMSPKDKTCIVLEVPCDIDDHLYKCSFDEFKKTIETELIIYGLLNEHKIEHFKEDLIPNAYPVLSLDMEQKLCILKQYLATFENLELLGRNANFEYTHTHNLFFEAQKKVDEF